MLNYCLYFWQGPPGKSFELGDHQVRSNKDSVLGRVFQWTKQVKKWQYILQIQDLERVLTSFCSGDSQVCWFSKLPQSWGWWWDRIEIEHLRNTTELAIRDFPELLQGFSSSSEIADFDNFPIVLYGGSLGFPGGSALPAVQETWVQSYVGKIHWIKEWLPTPVFLPGKSHGQRCLVGYSPRGCKELDLTEQLTLLFFCCHWCHSSIGFIYLAISPLCPSLYPHGKTKYDLGACSTDNYASYLLGVK